MNYYKINEMKIDYSFIRITNWLINASGIKVNTVDTNSELGEVRLKIIEITCVISVLV